MNEFILHWGFPVSHNLPLSVATVNTVNVVVPDGRSWEEGNLKDWKEGARVISWCLMTEGCFQLMRRQWTALYSLPLFLDYSHTPCLNLRFPSYHAVECISKNTHTLRGMLLFKLSFPRPYALVFHLQPILLPVGLPLSLYPSIWSSHMGFTSLSSMMACFFLLL